MQWGILKAKVLRNILLTKLIINRMVWRSSISNFKRALVSQDPRKRTDAKLL